MTIEELDDLYGQANKLIMARSVVAAGKALVFSSSSLDAAASDIADIYALTAEERGALNPGDQGTALATVQDTAAGLLGTDTPLDARKAVSIARTAIDGGHKIKAITAFLRAGPSAAEAAAIGGNVASKATVWGWVATAAYAAGTGSWFAYNLRSFNLAAYEVRRIREGLEAHPAGPSVRDLAVAGLTSVADVATDGAKAVGHGASATVEAVGHGASAAVEAVGHGVSTAMTGAAKGGGWLHSAATGLFRRSSAPSAIIDPQPEIPSEDGWGVKDETHTETFEKPLSPSSSNSGQHTDGQTGAL